MKVCNMGLAWGALLLLLAGCSEELSRSADGDGGGNEVHDLGDPNIDFGPPPPPCTGPPPTSQTFVTGTEAFSIPDSSAPQKCEATTDPLFHTTLSRVTDRDADGYTGDGILNEYAKADPENADGTLLLLRTLEGDWHLYDAAGFNHRRHLTVLTHGDQEPEPRWDPANPARLFYLDNMQLKTLDVTTMASTTVHDFSADVPGGDVITTHVEGDSSVDRNHWCFLVQSGDSYEAIVVYDRATDQVVGTKTDFEGEIDWLGMDMSGTHCVVAWDYQAAKSYNLDMSHSATLPEGTSGHADLALTAAGKDVLVYQNVQTDWIAMADLDSGQETNLIQIPFQTNTDIGMHFSGNCADAPGWALVSTYGARQAAGSHSWMDTHLFMVELTSSPRIWRLASTHCYTGDEPDTSNYWAEAFATINRRGTRVYWGSNWDQGRFDRFETYVALLPEGWTAQLP